MKITEKMITAAEDAIAIGESERGSPRDVMKAALAAALAVAEDEDFARAGQVLDELVKQANRKINGGDLAPSLRIEIAKASTALGLARHGLNAMGEWA